MKSFTRGKKKPAEHEEDLGMVLQFFLLSPEIQGLDTCLVLESKITSKNRDCQLFFKTMFPFDKQKKILHALLLKVLEFAE
jgi:hypothetical protein